VIPDPTPAAPTLPVSTLPVPTPPPPAFHDPTGLSWGQVAPPTPPEARGLDGLHSTRLEFTGIGAEYFRVWVVHTLLSLLTLGIYSAWAKARKARWFARHTLLLGDAFDYHAEPWRILVGRVLGLVLLAGYSFAFDWSFSAGLVMLGLLCALGPALFAGAQRFRLANTSWRGLRFGHSMPLLGAYRVGVPVLLVWTSGTVLTALHAPGPWLVAAGLGLLAVAPWAHARLKQIQHGHAHYAGRPFSFHTRFGGFYRIHASAFGIALVGGTVVGFICSLLGGLVPGAAALPGFFIGLVITAVTLSLFVWPYFAARTQQLVWHHTRWGELRFHTRIESQGLRRLVIMQVLATLFTAGLYWPFAAVALARYRVGAMSVLSEQPLDEVLAALPPSAAPGDGRASGDAAADLFGLDLGW
jgi:uncharacterized membrane protein YjgN (DUF898 family)